eukprot:COSAG06_NODE_55615_length_288_cov_2.126984_1_plen_24_part_10
MINGRPLVARKWGWNGVVFRAPVR